MAQVWKRYTADIYKALHYLAVWPPSASVEVGDVVEMQDGVLERQAAASNLGMQAVARDGAEAEHRGWASSSVTGLNVSASADSAVAPASAEMELRFDAKHGIFVRAYRSRERSLDRLDGVKRDLLRLREEGVWEANWVLVTHVVVAKELTVLVSQERGATARLSVAGSLPADATALATTAAKVQLISASGMAYEERNIANATPFFMGVRVQERRLRPTRAKRIDKDGRARPGTASFEVVDVAA